MNATLPPFATVTTGFGMFTGPLAEVSIGNRAFVSIGEPQTPFYRLVPIDEVKAIQPADPLVPTLETITQRVAAVFNVPVDSLLSRLNGCKREEYTVPRHAFFYVARAVTDKSLDAIGEFCNGRDHGTVLHGQRATQARMDTDPIFRQRIQTILNLFKT